MPLIETTGSASAKAFGLNSASQQLNYIEDVFSTYLYVGNGSTQTITNSIDLAGKGGLVWVKQRGQASAHALFDTARGVSKRLATNGTNAEATVSGVTAFGSTGFTSGSDAETNGLSNTYVSWTFRKQPKFFDVVTYTGDGTTNRAIAHSLGSAPGCIIVKNLSGGTNWAVYHRSLGFDYFLELDATGAATNVFQIWGNQNPNSTNFYVSQQTGGRTNQSGAPYVAYLFAHNAGGFGIAGTDNVISCGTFTGQTTVTLGWEPQWILRKRTDVAGDWFIHDTMRGFPANNSGSTAETAYLNPNLSGAESTTTNRIFPSATGFTTGSGLAGETYIYIAIRRGPMKTPTSGSTVYGNNITTSSSPEFAFPVDVVVNSNRGGSTYMNWWADRLRGSGRLLVSSETTAESAANFIAFNQGGYQNTFGNGWGVPSYINWGMRRAPGFMDVVCYTGTGVAGQTFAHNLGVVPELMIVKKRSSADQWNVYHSLFGGTKYLQLNSTAAVVTQDNIWNNTNPTASVFSVGVSGSVNTSGGTYVAYLFASCPGVSKVGSYSGTGATQTISCGFAVRFVLIKRTDSTGDWWVWDTTRGMVAGTDPRLALNLTSAETNANWVYTNASGFQIVTTDASVNASGGTYIYLAIA